MSPSSPPRHAARPAPRRRGPRNGGRRRGIVGLVIVLVLSLVSTIAVWVWTRGETTNEPTVTASSTGVGSSAQHAGDGGSASSPGADWRSDRETTGAWIELAWPQPRALRQVVVVRNPVDQPGVTDGVLAFGDGSFLQVRLSSTARETVVPITARSVDRVRFTVSAVAAGADGVTISEFLASEVPSGEVSTPDTADGNQAAVAAATVSTGVGDPRTLQDGSGRPGAAGAGAEWTVDEPVGAWVQLDWAHPQELSSVQVVGAVRSSASLSSATVTFGDGATIPVGAVLAAPDRPTVVSFMPRSTRSVRLTIDRVDGAGPLALGELRTYRRGATPARAPSPTPSATSAPDQVAAACDDPGPERPAAGLVVRCPTTGSVVDGRVAVRVAVAAGYSTVTARVLPGDTPAPAPGEVALTPDATGAATAVLDVGDVKPGPFTVELTAAGEGEPATVHFQLYRGGGGGPAPAAAAGPGAQGRTLVYAEEFDRPLSASRTGLDADYAASKPEVDGVEDFGDAIFADPAQGVAGPRVVDDSYLRIDVTPAPPGYPDPHGWARTHLGGLLASARPGGSGFSAQYGYFEARMLLPAAPGTWPAFWMLPSDNLPAPQPVVAEIDALEHYGHDPAGACHSTHEYRDGRDNGLGQCGQRFPTVAAALTWHTYGVSITPTAITFLIDGQVVATAPQVQGGGSPMFFLVNLALGGGWPLKLDAVQGRAVLYVDHVRVYV